MILFFIVVDILPVTMKLSTPEVSTKERFSTTLYEARVQEQTKRRLADLVFGSDDWVQFPRQA